MLSIPHGGPHPAAFNPVVNDSVSATDFTYVQRHRSLLDLTVYLHLSEQSYLIQLLYVCKTYCTVRTFELAFPSDGYIGC